MQQLSEDQIEHFEREGDIVLREFFGRIQVDDRLNVVRRAVRSMKPPARGEPQRLACGELTRCPWRAGPGSAQSLALKPSERREAQGPRSSC